MNETSHFVAQAVSGSKHNNTTHEVKHVHVIK